MLEHVQAERELDVGLFGRALVEREPEGGERALPRGALELVELGGARRGERLVQPQERRIDRRQRVAAGGGAAAAARPRARRCQREPHIDRRALEAERLVQAEAGQLRVDHQRLGA